MSISLLTQMNRPKSTVLSSISKFKTFEHYFFNKMYTFSESFSQELLRNLLLLSLLSFFLSVCNVIVVMKT